MVDKITLTLDEYDAANSPITRGSVYITPSTRVPGLIGRAPIEVIFSSDNLATVDLFPNDLIGPLQSNGNPGNSYQISYSDDFPGHPLSWSFYLLSANGPEQKLSDMESISVVRPGSRYLSLPTGAAPPANQIWISDGDGYSGHWIDMATLKGLLG